MTLFKVFVQQATLVVGDDFDYFSMHHAYEYCYTNFFTLNRYSQLHMGPFLDSGYTTDTLYMYHDEAKLMN